VLACSRLSGHVQPRVCLFHASKVSSNGHELSQLDHCLLWITLATLV